MNPTYSNIPINELTFFRAWAKYNGYKFKVRYRGPRRKGPQGQSTCLKKDALRFTAYPV